METHTHTDTHTDTQNDYRNPRCACAPRVNEIKSNVSDRITNEEDRMPSITAMWRHWLRSCWVAKMWTNSTEQNPYHNLLPPEEFGWCRNVGGDITGNALNYRGERTQ